MIQIEFFKSSNRLTGFEARGHSMSAPHGEDIVCAAVSSACLMAANTVTEVIGLSAEAKADEGYLHFAVEGNPAPAQDILEGLHLHLTELAKEYPQNINVTISEV